jgi:PAS domain-containing protein
MAPILSGEEVSRSLDVVRVRPDGARIPVEIRWQLVELPGPPASRRHQPEHPGANRDRERPSLLACAEHARAAELNAIIGAIGEGLIVLDAAGRVTLANPTARALLEPLDDWT